jgi:hypothetical protein
MQVRRVDIWSFDDVRANAQAILAVVRMAEFRYDGELRESCNGQARLWAVATALVQYPSGCLMVSNWRRCNH